MTQRGSAPQSPPLPVAPDAGDDARLCAPAAQRNADAIAALIAHHGPATGHALELASGTGQHVAHFAQALPGLTWQPSELDAARHASITAWTDSLANVRPVIVLDATAEGWSGRHNGYDLILVVNLLHLIDTPGARVLIAEAAAALAARGRLILYGPFLRDGETTSESDAKFHASLTAADPRIGYKDDFEMVDLLHGAGLQLVDLVEMPANNLSFVAEKPA